MVLTSPRMRRKSNQLPRSYQSRAASTLLRVDGVRLFPYGFVALVLGGHWALLLRGSRVVAWGGHLAEVAHHGPTVAEPANFTCRGLGSSGDELDVLGIGES